MSITNSADVQRIASALGAVPYQNYIPIEVYIPDQTKDGDHVDSHAQWADVIARAIITSAGGCSVSVVEGAFRNPDTGAFILETTVVVRAYASVTSWWLNSPQLREVLNRFKREAQQHTVAVVVGGVWCEL